MVEEMGLGVGVAGVPDSAVGWPEAGAVGGKMADQSCGKEGRGPASACQPINTPRVQVYLEAWTFNARLLGCCARCQLTT